MFVSALGYFRIVIIMLATRIDHFGNCYMQLACPFKGGGDKRAVKIIKLIIGLQKEFLCRDRQRLQLHRDYNPSCEKTTRNADFKEFTKTRAISPWINATLLSRLERKK